MKQGKIYLYNQYVGLLTEDETGATPTCISRTSRSTTTANWVMA